MDGGIPVHDPVLVGGDDPGPLLLGTSLALSSPGTGPGGTGTLGVPLVHGGITKYKNFLNSYY